MKLLEDPENVDLPDTVEVYYTDTDSGRLYYIEGYGTSYSLSYLARKIKWGYAINNPTPTPQPVQKAPHANQMWMGNGPPSASQGQDGDVYLDVENAQLYGPKKNSKWGLPSPIGDQVENTPGGVIYYQDIPSAVWVIDHELGYNPVGIDVMEGTTNRQLRGEVVYTIPDSQVTIIFDDAYAGQARLI